MDKFLKRGGLNNNKNNGIEITLEKPIVIKEIKETKILVSSFIVTKMVDEPELKRVSVFTNKLGRIVLWEGDDYDNIGQWTDDDVINRLKEIYS